ncbi:MAG: acyltransferase [Candidatus Nanoarchaeia archaeon]
MSKDYFVGKNSLITDDVVIGKGSKIWHFCNLYGCIIGENTQVGSYSEIKKDARIGNNCRLQSYVFVPEGTIIGNSVFVGPRATFLNDMFPTAEKASRGEWKLEEVVVEDNATIGGGAIIRPGIKIGIYSFIGGGSMVTKDVKPYSVVVGNPARIIGDVRDKKYAALMHNLK